MPMLWKHNSVKFWCPVNQPFAHLAAYFAQIRMKNGNTSPWCVNWCHASGNEPTFGTTVWHWHPKSMVMTNSTQSVEVFWASCTPCGDYSYFHSKETVEVYPKAECFERTKHWEVLECGDLLVMFMFHLLYTHKILESGSKVKKASVRPSTVLNYLWMSL